MTLQGLILGRQKIETEAQKRKILLGAYLIITFLGLDIFFFVVNFINPEGEPWSLFLGLFVAIICLTLIKQGWIDTAISLHLIRSNFTTFYFSLIDTDPYQTATYIYFISSSLGALAIFGYGERWKGIGFSLLSFLLFFIAYFDASRFYINNTHFYFIVNFSIVLIIGMLIMMFFDRLVVASEKIVIKKNKELVIANEELVKTNTELDRFVYSASHDLRAPLSSMLGLIEIAQRTENPEEIRQYLNMVKGRVHVLDSFIKQIVDHSRNSRISPKVEQVQIKNLIEEVADQLKFSPGFSSMKMQIDVPAALSILSDRSRFKIILENIISNSIKYRNSAIKNCYLRISGEEKGNRLIVEIEDNGIGIPEEHTEKIFDMFYRAHETSQGSGLGLYIVKEAIDKLGGSIEVKSKVGVGTVFKIILPKKEFQ